MLPFTIALRAGVPVYEQAVYAVRRAVATGQLSAGDPFPSVRELGHELKINPNTAHRIVALLVEEGLLVVRPGIGTVVAEGRRADTSDQRSVLQDGAERLVVNARHAGVSLADLLAAVRRHWSHTVNKAG